MAITPASGYVGARTFLVVYSLLSYKSTNFLAAAVVFGVVGGTACNFSTQLKFILGYDDALDASIQSYNKLHSG